MATITLKRNHIQFEMAGWSDLAEGGNGQMYTDRAARVWDSAATRHIEAAGHQANVQIGHDKDHHAVRIYVAGMDEAEGRAIAEAADEAGWDAVAADIEQENQAAINRVTADIEAELAKAEPDLDEVAAYRELIDESDAPELCAKVDALLATEAE